MSRPEGLSTSVLPQLEQELVRAARRRSSSSRRRRLFVTGIVAISLLVAAGAVAATTGILGVGAVSNQRFAIELHPSPEAKEGQICLRLRVGDGPAAHGCGGRPSRRRAFGPLIADSAGPGDDRVVYGLVADGISTVRVLTVRGEPYDAPAELRSGVPGRFFSAVVPERGGIALIALGPDRTELGRIGHLEGPARQPRSRSQARRQGNPAGFAPTAPTPRLFLYEGRPIAESEATRRGLACLQRPRTFQCYDRE